MEPRDRGQAGVALIFSLLLTAALVAWSVTVLTTGDEDRSTGERVREVVAEPADTTDETDPANAPAFDGPKHERYDATVPEVMKGAVHDVVLESTDQGTFEVAKDRYMNLWTFGGTVPGPVIRVTQGDRIDFTIKNTGSMAHSIDFHAAEIAPNRAYIDVQPGESFKFSFDATQPGVYMYHCATAPVLHHIGNGMYGMLIVEPKGAARAPAREYAIVQSEFYFGGQGNPGDLAKMEDKAYDWLVFNGHASQYVDEPLPAEPGELVRLYILNAGPSEWSAFHVIGTIFDWTWQEGVVGGPAQTVNIAPSQGAIVEFTMEEPGTYPFVTHAFADAVKGGIGIFKVGDGGPAGGHGSD